MSEEKFLESLLAKGRIAVWLIISASAFLAYEGVLSGEQFAEIVKYVAGIWLTGEVAIRAGGEKR